MFKKVLCLALTAAQLGQFLAISPAFSAEPDFQASASPRRTPEFKLFKNAIELEGENLPPQTLQSGVAGLWKQYAATAKPVGAEQRLAEALVQLRLYTPSQANALVAKFDSASQRLMAQHFTTEQAADRAITQQVSSILLHTPAGAQFSACGVATVADITLFVGGGLALLGAGVDALQAASNGGYSNQGLDTSTGTAELAIGGAAGIGIGVGLIYLLSSLHACR